MSIKEGISLSTKVSIIIPVYNAQTYLRECIQSLINQTMKECEFIFVDDGSDDNSSNIIQEYNKVDDRIKFITQKNKGVSSARNKGLVSAVGEYIGFVDADDYIEENMIYLLYMESLNKNLDVIISNFEMELAGKKSLVKYNFPKGIELERNDIREIILPYFLEKDDLNSVCNKLYKSKLIKEHKIRFPKNIALGEDRAFNIQVFSNAKKALYFDYSGYFYREVKGSATRNILEKDYFKRALEAHFEDVPTIYKDLLNEDKINNLRKKKLVKLVFSYIHLYFEPSDVSFHQRYKYVKSMIHNESFREALLVYSPIFKSRYERLMVNFVEKRSTLGVLLLTRYSSFRNKNSGGNPA
ncbi:glycosyltransferase family 2 protein [Robertmurraya sp. FSL R5-0851]|uniref:glycosyltransferase family 2 protein n=1 Tax=Robertmurraya sp. FSL R5-0851 TaxID=2921584 RepID=UPI0030FBCC6D